MVMMVMREMCMVYGGDDYGELVMVSLCGGDGDEGRGKSMVFGDERCGEFQVFRAIL